MESKYLEFVEVETNGKTKTWELKSLRGGVSLGTIKWYSGWRKYCFQPFGGTIFDPTCQREIADFCEQQTNKREDSNI